MDRSHFIDNVDKTREGGAALYFHFDPGQLITIKRSSFIGNTIFNQDVQTYGGAIRLTDRATVDSCYFEGNQADEGGAIFVDATAHLSATNTSFVANEASVGGAGGGVEFGSRRVAGSGNYTGHLGLRYERRSRRRQRVRRRAHAGRRRGRGKRREQRSTSSLP